MKTRMLFATFFGSSFGLAFENREVAARYPGPRGLELAERTIVPYVPHELIAEVADQNHKMRMVLEANLREFKVINESGLWQGHPFALAIKEIEEVLDGTLSGEDD